MAKKKNIVKKTKEKLVLIIIVTLAAGWLLSLRAVRAGSKEMEEQDAMIDTAKIYLEDKLYVRAAAQYTEALNTYHTENNPRYETELLAIYKEGGMTQEYYSMIDSRISSGMAGAEEYLDRAQSYIDKGSGANAMTILQKGMTACNDERLTELYESVSYEYSYIATAYSEMKIPSSDWYIPAYDGERWGYVGVNGRTNIAFDYEEAVPFSGNYAVVKIDGVYTLIDKEGLWNAVDKNGLDTVTSLLGTRLIGVKDGQYGIYSNTFNRLGSESYDNAYFGGDGLIMAQKGGKWAILDNNLNMVTDYIFTDVAVNSRGLAFSGDYAVVADETGYFLINRDGEACFENRFAGAKGVEEGLFAVQNDDGKWGFADEKGQLIVEYKYDDAYSFSNRLAAVKYAGEWGYINKYGTLIMDLQYEQAYPFLEGSALVVDTQGRYRIVTLRNYKLF